MEPIDFDAELAERRFEERFRAINAPLEAVSGAMMKPPGLQACRELFKQKPEVYEQLARVALKKAYDPVAYLCLKVLKGDDARLTSTSPPERSPLERALTWAENAGRLLELDHREEILARFGLSDDETAHVRLKLLGPTDIEPRYTRMCDSCGAHPCICDLLAA